MAAVLLTFLFSPVILCIVYLLKGKKKVEYSAELPAVSLVMVARNAEELIEIKLQNALSLNYPKDRYEIVFFSDGSNDETEKRAKAFSDNNIHVFSSSLHEGKNMALNKAVRRCSGEILVFTDVDAVLDPDALLKLVRYFADPEVGGVCGMKVIMKDGTKLKVAQSVYTQFAGLIKTLESHTGSISSNDGTLYAIRRDLFKDIPTVVTDDLYVCLSIVRQNYRFLFEPEAKVFIEAPSRSYQHELQRRRRIVSTSLRGIFMLKELLNPFRYGMFSLNLITNKILRRLLPVFLFLLLLSTVILSFYNAFFLKVLIVQLAFYTLALAYLFFLQHIKVRIIIKVASIAFYFCLGNYGTLLGLVDFLKGRRVTKWDPVK
jgi:biofilm PGA synthesis N-glycosyltransferase PgaC